LGKFPNTYTYTKNLAEKSLWKNRGQVPVVLLRPSIIASSLESPFPGWTDSLSAAGGLTLMSGLGLINYINAQGVNRFDVIPVDIVTNSIIVATANGANVEPMMEIYNCGTSVQNPITMEGYKVHMINALNYHEFNKRAMPVSLEFVKNKLEFKLKKGVWNDLPF